MKQKQHTIRKQVSVSGVGLHTGKPSTLTFLPAPGNHGIKFQRVDLEGQPIIEADVDNVVDLSRGTTIAKNGAVVNTVEHTLAAFVGLEIDNVLIQIDGPEPPILDGSSIGFIEALEEAGVEEQNYNRNFFEITEGVFYSDPERNIDLAALPLNDYRVTVMVDYNSPVLGSQHASLNNITDFKKEIAPCRTFCFLHEIEYLFKQNLIQGGALNNAVVIVDRAVSDDELQRLAELFKVEKVAVTGQGILNNVELRYKDEPARHKLLDVLGDLALIGRPIKAQILAARTGHAANVALAKKIKKLIKEQEKKQGTEGASIPDYDPTKPMLHDAVGVANILPHRYPFALVDGIYHLDETSVAGIKNVTMNENFFQGHFPNNPVMPGVLMIEAMAQTGGILALSTVPDPQNYWTYFLGIENARFRKLVVPGMQLVFKLHLTAPIRRGFIKMKGVVLVNKEIVCEAEMSASIIRKK